MSVLQQILEWSTDRPLWQRDALRRLVLSGDLSDVDINDLTEICKASHGLAEVQDVEPLTHEHIPDRAVGAPVSLVSIFHHRGVNALAEDQTLNFGPGLTIVYGDNGAGKTGYIRILKGACRARGQETILGNVVSGNMPLTPVVSIRYRLGEETDYREWTGGIEDEYVTRVSIFDTQCAAVYLNERTDVAFRPFGLDLFDKLVKACKSVRAKLESEQHALTRGVFDGVLTEVPIDTTVAKLLSNISSLTKPEVVKSLAQLSPEEDDRYSFVEKSLRDLQANDPQKLIRQLTLRTGRIQGLVRHLKEVETCLADNAVTLLFQTRSEGRRKSAAANHLREATFPQELLRGTGTDVWKDLWEAARLFSEQHAYKDKPFPVIENGAQCVLCQQNLDTSASQRFRHFEDFVASTVERELRRIRATFAQQRKTIADLITTTEAVDDLLKEISIEHQSIAEDITFALATNETRRAEVLSALAKDQDLPDQRTALVSMTAQAELLLEQTEERIKTLRSSTNDQTRKSMEIEAREFRARKMLARNQQIVLDEIERQQKIAAYGLCINDTRSQTITTKSTAVTKATVSDKLKKSFQEELINLSFRHVEVELKEDGGSGGVFYHRLVLTRAPGVVLPTVVSEGEERCLSIAAFFAELSTADDLSGIVFDDPVSSLDFQWRNSVARRLVHEAQKRQVIVFTHDVVFLLLLRQYSEELGVESLDQHVRKQLIGAGVCAEELPWVALNVKKKIGFLNKRWQDADKLLRYGYQDEYEKEAKHIYGLLRETWERALEEVLLCGVVERYRPSVQTKQIGQIADINVDDCRAVETSIAKCSKWLPGHDQAPAARESVPDSMELKTDINALESWVSSIRKRRGSATTSQV